MTAGTGKRGPLTDDELAEIRAEAETAGLITGHDALLLIAEVERLREHLAAAGEMAKQDYARAERFREAIIRYRMTQWPDFPSELLAAAGEGAQ